jgi:hypothetical protein
VIALVYLARAAEGLDPLRRFRDSYAAHPAGIDHNLVVIYKGFRQAGALDAARAVFAPLRHAGIELPDAGYDIGAYLGAARRLADDYVCFVNTFTEVAAAGWLGHLHRQAVSPEVGIAGATGSYESLHSSLELANKVRWLCNDLRIPYDRRLVHYYDFVLRVACPTWKRRGSGARISAAEDLLARLKAWRWRYRASRSFVEAARRASPALPVNEQFERHWSQLLRPGRPMADYAQFPPFPNPHVRTNGFMLRRDRLLELGFPTPPSKIAACAFESGAEGLTSRLRRRGLRARVVDRQGRGYDVHEWPGSRTFRLQEQQDLLVRDKQTRAFDAMPPGERYTHRRLTWGSYAGPAPADFPDLDLPFADDAARLAA